MKSNIFKNITIFFISCLFITIFLEILNYFYSGVPIYDKFKIDRNQLSYIKSKNKNSSFMPEVNNLEIDKFRIIRCGYQESGKYHLFYLPDKNGFRENLNELYLNTDIVLIGDSFGFSSCVNSPFDLKSNLQKYLNKKVLNLSVSGTGPIEQFKIIEKFTKDTNFKTFIWLFYEGNDHNQLKNINDRLNKMVVKPTSKILKSKSEIFVNYQEINQNLNFLDFEWKNENEVKLKIYISEKLRGLNSFIKLFFNYTKVDNNENYEKILKKMEIYLSKKKIQDKYIYFIPKYTRLSHKKKDHPEIEYLNSIKEYVEKLALMNGFKFIDGTKFLEGMEKSLDVFHYNLPTHFNEKGYNLTAHYLSKHLNN